MDGNRSSARRLDAGSILLYETPRLLLESKKTLNLRFLTQVWDE